MSEKSQKVNILRKYLIKSFFFAISSFANIRKFFLSLALSKVQFFRQYLILQNFRNTFVSLLAIKTLLRLIRDRVSSQLPGQISRKFVQRIEQRRSKINETGRNGFERCRWLKRNIARSLATHLNLETRYSFRQIVGYRGDERLQRVVLLEKRFTSGRFSFSQDSQPVGAVMLIRYDVEQTPELRLHSFAIKKQGAPTLRLAADTEEVAARWTTFIKEAIERNDQVNVASYARSRVTLDVYFRDMIREETSDVVSCTNTKRGSTCVSEV